MTVANPGTIAGNWCDQAGPQVRDNICSNKKVFNLRCANAFSGGREGLVARAAKNSSKCVWGWSLTCTSLIARFWMTIPNSYNFDWPIFEPLPQRWMGLMSLVTPRHFLWLFLLALCYLIFDSHTHQKRLILKPCTILIGLSENRFTCFFFTYKCQYRAW